MNREILSSMRITDYLEHLSFLSEDFDPYLQDEVWAFTFSVLSTLVPQVRHLP